MSAATPPHSRSSSNPSPAGAGGDHDAAAGVSAGAEQGSPRCRRIRPTTSGSCKGKLCPSCLARRTADTAAWLVDRLLPEAGYRLWVLSFPWTLRFRLAADRRLFGVLLRDFLQILFAWQRRRGRECGIVAGQTGAVSFVQRFGGALNLNAHAHSILPDGLWVDAADRSPDGAAVERLRFEPLLRRWSSPTAACRLSTSRQAAGGPNSAVSK